MPVELVISLVVLITALLAIHLTWKKRARTTLPRHRDADLVKVVLGLEQKTLDDLFELYRREFGAGAARYARRTYNKWRAGAVRPNRETFNRLLVRLPEVMSFEQKCEVLRKFRREYCAKDNYRLTVDTRNWKETVDPLLKEIINKSYKAELPPHIEGRLRWLAANDMRVARELLARSEAEESENALLQLEREFDGIQELLRAAGRRGAVTHTIKLPAGTIELKIEAR
jgi:hypothetical protein